MKLARLGVQIGLWQYALVNATPCFTSWSNTGVLTWGFPNAPMVSNRCWSVQYQRIFGLFMSLIARLLTGLSF